MNAIFGIIVIRGFMSSDLFTQTSLSLVPLSGLSFKELWID